MPPIRKAILFGIKVGLFFAIFMGLFDYYLEGQISWFKFIFQFVFFGSFMAYLGWRTNKEKEAE